MKKENSDGVLKRIPCDQIRPLEGGQPRTHFDKEKLEELANSIEERGQENLVVVRPLPEGGFELLGGERRVRACIMKGIPNVLAWVRRNAGDAKGRFMSAFISNLSEGLLPLDIKDALIRLRKELELTQLQLARMIGKSQSWVNAYEVLDNLIPQVQAMMSPELPESKRLLFSQAKRIASLSPKNQLRFARNAVEQGLNDGEVKYMIETNLGRRIPEEKMMPRKERKEFDKLLRRINMDLDLVLGKKQSKFRLLFENRTAEDMKRIIASIEKAEKKLELLKGAIIDVRAGR